MIVVAERLVKQEQLRVRRNRAGDGDTLLLTAGQLVRITVAIFLDPHGFERAHNGFFDLGLAHLFDLQTERDVLEHGHVRPQGVALEHQVQTAVFRLLIEGLVGVDDRTAVDGHGAMLRLFKAGDNAQGGGFAAAGRAEQRHKIAVLDREVDIAQNMVFTVEFINVT